MLVALLMLCVVVSIAAIRSASTELRLSLGLYLGAYGITSVAGGVLLSFHEILDSWVGGYLAVSGIELRLLDVVTSWRFAAILLSPLVVVPLVSVTAEKFSWPLRHISASKPYRWGISLGVWVCVFLILAAYCFWRFHVAGMSSRLLNLDLLWDQYQTHITARREAFSAFGTVFFGLLYVGIPALSFVAFLKWMERRNPAWGAAFAISVIVVAWFLLATAQKAPLIAYLIMLCVAAWSYSSRKTLAFMTGALVVFFTVTVVQLLFRESWELFDTILHLLLRVGVAIPYYAAIYPEYEAFAGIDLGLDLLGLASARYAFISQTVFDYVYPTVTSIAAGNAPAPAHVNAYAEGGLLYMLFTEVVVAAWIVFTAWVLRRMKGPIGQAFGLSCLLTIYYLSQVSFRLSIVGSYGILWPTVILAAYSLINVLFLAALARDPQLDEVAVTARR